MKTSSMRMNNPLLWCLLCSRHYCSKTEFTEFDNNNYSYSPFRDEKNDAQRDIRQLVIFHLQEVAEQEEVTKQSTSKDLVHTYSHSEILSPFICFNNISFLFLKE